jgi:hypothetical protein
MLVIYNKGVQRDKGCIYKEPKVNINMTASLFLKLRFRWLSSGIGSKIITMSSKMLNPAIVKTTTLELIHFAFMPISQTALTGIHCKVRVRENTKASQTIHAKQILVKRRKRWSWKIRRKRRIIEALARLLPIT